MPQLALKHCYIADVEMDENGKDEKNRIVKINVNEEDFFDMLDHVNPKNIIKYLDMRGIPHRDALTVNIKPLDAVLDSHKKRLKKDTATGLYKCNERNKRKIVRVSALVKEYGGKVLFNDERVCNK